MSCKSYRSTHGQKRNSRSGGEILPTLKNDIFVGLTEGMALREESGMTEIVRSGGIPRRVAWYVTLILVLICLAAAFAVPQKHHPVVSRSWVSWSS
jgi:hypothetical protein